MAKRAANKKAAPKKAATKRSGPTIGETACKAIRAGRTNEETLAAVLKSHPDAKTTMASVAWYRNDLRKRGEKVPTSREITAARNAKKSPRKAAKKS